MKNVLEANKSYLISSVVFIPLFILIFWIYGYDILVSFYGVLLYITISLPIMVYRTIKYKKSIDTLENLKNNMFLEEFENISFENNILEKKFYEIYKDKNEMFINEKNINEQTLKERDEYLTMWTHQVKTPISVMSLIAEKEEDKTLKMEVLKANEYINQMINYMKAESLSQDYVFKTVKLSKIINNSVKKYRFLFFEKNLSVNVDIVDIEIVTDEKWLSFVIQQVIFNAIKYTEKGRVEIYNEKDNPYNIYIRDTGIGIPSTDLKNIIKWGFTGENGRLDKNSTGIGLYLVDKILGKFDYDYLITSEVGIGTTFNINLKRKEIILN